jgi:hypothetical protein
MSEMLGIDGSRRELHELRVAEWADFGLAGVAMALSIAATEVAPAFSLPFFLGGVAVLVMAVRTVYRRWDLCESLLLDPDAYDIAEIQARAEQLASLAERRRLAHSIRALLSNPVPARRKSVELVAAELSELAVELDDEELVLEPICAVRCRRLLTDGAVSALLNPALPADGLRIAVARIRAGFQPRS